MQKLNWGIIGLGAVAQKFSEAFTQTSNSILLAIASNNSQKLESFCFTKNVNEIFWETRVSKQF